MKIESILMNFRNALLALLPAIEYAGISWQRPHAYDQWDNIASALFKGLVMDLIRDSVPSKEVESISIPPYDLLLSTYANLSTVEISHPLLPFGRWAFHAFGTINEPFDTIEVREISESGSPLSEELVTCLAVDAEFRLRLHLDSGSPQLLENIFPNSG